MVKRLYPIYTGRAAAFDPNTNDPPKTAPISYTTRYLNVVDLGDKKPSKTFLKVDGKVVYNPIMFNVVAGYVLAPIPNINPEADPYVKIDDSGHWLKANLIIGSIEVEPLPFVDYKSHQFLDTSTDDILTYINMQLASMCVINVDDVIHIGHSNISMFLGLLTPSHCPYGLYLRLNTKPVGGGGGLVYTAVNRRGDHFVQISDPEEIRARLELHANHQQLILHMAGLL